MTNQSEVARLMAQIDQEYQAAEQAMHGPCQGSSTHQFISAKYTRIGALGHQLGQLVGEDKATGMIIDQMDKSGQEPKGDNHAS